jgi:glutathione peroxidase
MALKNIVKMVVGSLLTTQTPLAYADPSSSSQSLIHSIKVSLNSGKEISLKEYEGKVLLIVNTASRCGFTAQYADLESLYEKFKSSGFLVAAFPSNDFGSQEPLSNSEIKNFCETKFKVTFPLFDKKPVSGNEIQPLFRYLTKEGPEEFRGDIAWNFEKFLIDKKGQVRNRYGSFTKPMSSTIVNDIEKLIAE